MNIVKSGKFKDAGSPFRKMDAEDQKLLQTLVNESYEQFLQTVAKARGLEVEKVRSIADGRVILGANAVSLGLADEVGGVERAAKLALEAAGDNEEPEIVPVKKAATLSGLLGGLQQSELADRLGSLLRTRLLYQSFM